MKFSFSYFKVDQFMWFLLITLIVLFFYLLCLLYIFADHVFPPF